MGEKFVRMETSRLNGYSLTRQHRLQIGGLYWVPLTRARDSECAAVMARVEDLGLLHSHVLVGGLRAGHRIRSLNATTTGFGLNQLYALQASRMRKALGLVQLCLNNA